MLNWIQWLRDKFGWRLRVPHHSLEERVERLELQVRELEHNLFMASSLIRKQRELLDRLVDRVAHLEKFTGINEVASFSITGDDMSIKGIAPGATGTFTATPLDGSGNPIPLPAGAQPPVWTSSDTTNAPVVASADGLSASVSVPETTGGGSFTLTVSSPDLPGQPSGSVAVPINVAPPPPPPAVAGFSIDQTS